MPRMIDLVRKSQMSSNMMQAAARGALAVQAGEMIEILVHLSLHNKVFGELARMTLAGWDEKASRGVAGDPATSKEVLEYLISPRNIRPALLPALLENPSISEEVLAELAASGSRDVAEAMLVSKRVSQSPALIAALKTNPRLRTNELASIHTPTVEAAHAEVSKSAAPPDSTIGESSQPATDAEPVSAEQHAAEPIAQPETETEDEHVLAQAIAHYLQENAAELAAQGEKPFEAVPASVEGLESSEGTAEQAHPAPGEGTGAAPQAQPHAATPETYASLAAKHAKAMGQQDRRDSALQKIAKLDIKGRIALAVRGGKEERTILIRDGTKLVALAVLDSPKITDGEVEKIALQKNVLEAVLRAIPLKRRFAKNYAIMRNLVFNPRTPLDLALGLMKNLLIHDLKNLSGNKEVPETIRKLALRMFKQKMTKKD